MNGSVKPRLGSYLGPGLLIVCCLAAGSTVLRSSSRGMDFSPDSVSYFTMAEGIVAGKGFVDVRRYDSPAPTTYPPGYPLLLALASLGAGGSLMASIPGLHACLFAASTLLFGSVLFTYSRSWLLTLLGALLFVASGDMVTLHGNVWSEVPFLFCTLLFVRLMAAHLERPRWSTLAAAAASAGVAVLVRYPGIAVIAAGCLVLAVRPVAWRRKAEEVLLFGSLASSLLVLWLVRNLAQFGRPYLGVDRGPSSFAFSLRNLERGLETLHGWTGDPAGSYLLCLALFFTGLLVASLGRSRSTERRERDPAFAMGARPLALTIGAFVLTYGGLMLAGTYAYGLHKALDFRTLSPIFGPVSWSVLLAGWHCAVRLGQRRCVWCPRGRRMAVAGDGMMVAAAALLLWLAGSSVVRDSDPKKVHGILQRPPRAVVEAFRDIEPTGTVFTNIDDTLYLLTGKQCLRLPQLYHFDSREVLVPDYEQKVAAFKRRLGKDGMIVYYTPSRRHYLPSEDDLKKLLPLRAVVETADGSIYEIAADAPRQ